MTMTRLQLFLATACELLGIQIDIPFTVVTSVGVEIVAQARIPNFGASRGILVFEQLQQPDELQRRALVSSGYGISIYGEPPESEEFDLDSYVEMFVDWGWTGDSSTAPDWIGAFGNPARN